MPTEQQRDESIESPPIRVVNTGRRRLGKAGLGAAGVLLTLESRVAMATTPHCVAPSAAALSHGGNSNYVKSPCKGNPPEYWAGKTRRWPCAEDIKFGALFTCGPGSSKYAKVKLVDILRGYDSHRNDYRSFVGRAVAATYFNILAGDVTVLDEKTLFKMWRDLQSGNSYSPVPKVYWSASDVRNYLETTYRA